MIKMQHTKWERDKCPHGKFRWVRWTYPDNSTVEDSTPEYSACSCKLCNEDITWR